MKMFQGIFFFEIMYGCVLPKFHFKLSIDKKEEYVKALNRRIEMYKNSKKSCEKLRRKRVFNFSNERKERIHEQLSKYRNLERLTERNDEVEYFEESRVNPCLKESNLNNISHEPTVKREETIFAQYVDNPTPSLIIGLVGMLRNDCIDIRRQSAKILAKVLSKFEKFIALVVENAGLTPLITNLSDDDAEIRFYSLVTIGLIISKDSAYREMCTSMQILPIICQFTTGYEMEDIVWILSMLCTCAKNISDENQRASENVERIDQLENAEISYYYNLEAFIPILGRFLYDSNHGILSFACVSLGYLASISAKFLDKILEIIPLNKITELIDHSNRIICLGALTIIVAIFTHRCCTRLKTHIHGLLNSGIMSRFIHLLNINNDEIREISLRVLSNIVIHGCAHSYALKSDLILPIVTCMKCAKYSVREEACVVISSIIGYANMYEIHTMVKAGALMAACDLLTVNDEQIICLSLTIIKIILGFGEMCQFLDDNVNSYCEEIKKAHGVDKLVFLEQNSSDEIRAESLEILKKYFPGREQIG